MHLLQVNYFDEKLRQYARKTISPSTLENQKLLDEAKEVGYFSV